MTQYKRQKKADWSYRTPAEGRPKPVSGTAPHSVKLRCTLWTQRQLWELFRREQIGAREHQWFLTAEKPNRNLTPEDILHIALAPEGEEYVCRYNIEKKILIIEDLNLPIEVLQPEDHIHEQLPA